MVNMCVWVMCVCVCVGVGVEASAIQDMVLQSEAILKKENIATDDSDLVGGM